LEGEVPIRDVRTIYSVVGDVLPWTNLFGLFWVLLLIIRGGALRIPRR